MKNLIYLILIASLISCNNNSNNNSKGNINYALNENKSNTNNYPYSSKVKDLRDREIYDSMLKVNHSKAIELEKYFKKEKDEFSTSGKTWYKPKVKPYAINTGIYCYFEVNNNLASNFRLVIQYGAEDWIFFKSVIFLIDDKVIEYTPKSVDRDNSSGYIWEWSDENVEEFDYGLINALVKGKNVKMKYMGSPYYSIKKVPTKYIESIAKTLEMYKLKGGQFAE